jgi:hypothetical protein
MDDAAFRKLAANAQADQASAGMSQFAQLIGQFYTSLVASGIPKPLAQTMVRDWLRIQLQKMPWPDAPPPFRGDE